ncbi:MAG: hypothetical protein US34_C0013G0014 [Candidatus Nomurabacteria bacterium GW2011_GWC2_36_9]|nr:MAG: hypothetical protein US34_C0013G0014 [Candidatus Nomurabacteria bacterium GW2011_GWC2_36_9]
MKKVIAFFVIIMLVASFGSQMPSIMMVSTQYKLVLYGQKDQKLRKFLKEEFRKEFKRSKHLKRIIYLPLLRVSIIH